MQPVLYADLRCLQDHNYRLRGIGHHVAALLRTRRHSAFSACKTIGLVDPHLPELTGDLTSLVDELSCSLNPCSNGVPAVFIDASPLTHDTRFALRFQSHSAFLRAAVLYDFIPLDWPGYLPTVAGRINYVSKIGRLKNFDLLLPISEYTAARAAELLSVHPSRIRVTGASVRRSLYELRDRSMLECSINGAEEPYFLTVGGGDRRKNTETAVRAVRHLNLVYARRIPLKVVGHYDSAYKCELLQLAGHAQGAGFLEFYSDISDEELIAMHLGAIAAIAPSHIEGFSLPVVEASVCGCPVIASTCAAHMELIGHEEALFPSGDAGALCGILERLLHESALRDSVIASQVHLGPKFHEDAVGRRFWTAVEAAADNWPRTTAISTRKKPHLAFLSPYPPDSSGCARYTAMTMRAGEQLFDSDLYTDAPRPLTFHGSFRDAGGINLAPLMNGAYNGIIAVLGNSHFHTPIFEFFERYGGPCILHDARLTQIYFHRFGPERFIEFAAKLLSRPVAIEEVYAWLQDRNPPSLFIERVIERASPLIVHTVKQQAEIKKRYGAEAHVATCCPTVFFSDEELTVATRTQARKRLGIPPSTFLVSSFGYVARTKGMESCVLATEFLRSWNIPVELYFVGSAGLEKCAVDRIAGLYGITDHVHSNVDVVDDSSYRDFLLASDAGVQLRTYGFGQLSAALTDCISAGLPCVASRELAESCDAPAYVSTVPDWFSPLQVAEQLALIWEARNRLDGHADARASYLKTHNFEYYGKRLIEILGIA